jgi:hypothetical protein
MSHNRVDLGVCPLGRPDDPDSDAAHVGRPICRFADAIQQTYRTSFRHSAAHLARLLSLCHG